MNTRKVCVALVLVMAASVLAQGKGKGKAGARAQGVIDDPQAVTYSNTWIRTSADRLAHIYYESELLVDRWNALGAGQEALDVLRTEINRIADMWGTQNHSWVHKGSLVWLTYQNLTGTPLIPNTSDVIVDGAGVDARPVITGVDANNIVVRVYEFLTWMDTGAFNPNPNGGGGGPWLYTVIDVSDEGRPDVDLARAGLFINRCQEIIAEYDANNGQKLNTILAVAPSPRP